MHWAVAGCIGCGGGSSMIFNINDTDDKQMTQTMKVMIKKHLKLNEYPSYPHTSGRMEAMAIDSPIDVGGSVVVVVVACMSFGVLLLLCAMFLVCGCGFLALVCVW